MAPSTTSTRAPSASTAPQLDAHGAEAPLGVGRRSIGRRAVRRSRRVALTRAEMRATSGKAGEQQADRAARPGSSRGRRPDRGTSTAPARCRPGARTSRRPATRRPAPQGDVVLAGARRPAGAELGHVDLVDARRGGAAPWRASRHVSPGAIPAPSMSGATGARGRAPSSASRRSHLVEVVGDGHDVATGDEQSHGGVGVASPPAARITVSASTVGGIAVVGDGARTRGRPPPGRRTAAIAVDGTRPRRRRRRR